MIGKRQWGAFYGTDLDLQLRRRGIDTILLIGIATNIGVESTVRDAFERGYQQVFVEDAMASLSPDEHASTVRTVVPRIGRVALHGRGAGRAGGGEQASLNDDRPPTRADA